MTLVTLLHATWDTLMGRVIVAESPDVYDDPRVLEMERHARRVTAAVSQMSEIAREWRAVQRLQTQVDLERHRARRPKS